MISLRDESARTLAALIEKLELYQDIIVRLLDEKNKFKTIKSVDKLLDANDKRLTLILDKFKEYRNSKINCTRLNEHMTMRVGKLAGQRQALDNFLTG